MSSCELGGDASKQDNSVVLAEFEENHVQVTIRLEWQDSGASEYRSDMVLAGVFTPSRAGYHLYSKDLPRNGVDGLGRPTLLELATGSKMQVVGALQESPPIQAEPAVVDYPDLKVYPAGPVTLRLPVQLPQTGAELVDEVSVTYMACKNTVCDRPVIDKIITVTIPADLGSE